MQALNHPNIVKFHHYEENYQNYFYFLELIQGDDLYEHVIEKTNDRRLTENQTNLVIK